ncbi:MAG: glutathione S-transferase family protein [Devosia sp.]
MQLYDFELSADCYKLRLFMSILGLRWDTVPIDMFPGRQHEGTWFKKISPNGEMPLLDDDGFKVTGSEPGLIYLAGKFDPTERWMPLGAAGIGPDLRHWLATAQTLGATAGLARLTVNFGYDHDLPALQHAAHTELRRVDEHLWFAERQQRDWLCDLPHPTIADIACFPDIALCEEGGVSRQDYPAVRRWMDRVKRIAGFTPMSGVFPTAAAI